MGTQLKVWEINDGHVSEVGDHVFAANHQEKDLEDWVCEQPDLIYEDLLVIARQQHVPGGYLDLLGIDSAGQLVLIELKRDMAPRLAVAQALDYASWLDSVTPEEVMNMAEQYLKGPLGDKFYERFNSDLPPISPQNHKLLLVATELDASAERIINYLAQKRAIDVNAVFFRYAKLSSGKEVLVRSVLVPEATKSPVDRSGKVSVADLLRVAAERQCKPILDTIRTLTTDPNYLYEYAENTYGSSFRNWRKNLEGKDKMVLGVNVSGDRRATPKGKLDLWINFKTMAGITGESEQEVKTRLKEFPVLEYTGDDCIIRLDSVAAASDFVKKLKGWFDEHPGYYKKANVGAATAGA